MCLYSCVHVFMYDRDIIVNPMTSLLYEKAFQERLKARSVMNCMDTNVLGLWSPEELDNVYEMGIYPSKSGNISEYKRFSKMLNHMKIDLSIVSIVYFDPFIPFISQVMGQQGLVTSIISFASVDFIFKWRHVCKAWCQWIGTLKCKQGVKTSMLVKCNSFSQLYFLSTTTHAEFEIFDRYDGNLDYKKILIYPWPYMKFVKISGSFVPSFKSITEKEVKLLRKRLYGVLHVSYEYQAVKSLSNYDGVKNKQLNIMHALFSPVASSVVVKDSVSYTADYGKDYPYTQFSTHESHVEISASVKTLKFISVNMGYHTFLFLGNKVRYLELVRVKRYQQELSYVERMVNLAKKRLRPCLKFILFDNIKDTSILTYTRPGSDTITLFKDIIIMLNSYPNIRGMEISWFSFKERGFSIMLFYYILQANFMVKIHALRIWKIDVNYVNELFVRKFLDGIQECVINNKILDIHGFFKFNNSKDITIKALYPVFDMFKGVYGSNKYGFRYNSYFKVGDKPHTNVNGFELVFDEYSKLLHFNIRVGDDREYYKLLQEKQRCQLPLTPRSNLIGYGFFPKKK